MAVVKHPIDKNTDPAQGICHICGERSNAMWMCAKADFFEVCSTCAKEKLPLIIADAIGLGTKDQWAAAESALHEVTSAFWRGLAIRGMRENSELRESRNGVGAMN
jgi:hypothetical protein